jgi:TolB-like protein/tRNA A-37 threonylcarbamoyl transferase component Bud32
MSERLEQLKASLSGRYEIERELGQGGMATVYLATDVRHQRQVALKVLRSDLAQSLGADRFLREIRIAANLNHPHILALFDSGEADGFLFYVMPYIKGSTLRERIDKEGELPIREAVRIVREVADALAFAHSQGVVHRDIKPDNVMLAGNHAVVADFGVAKAVSEATGRDKLTTAGVALGTPAYMAPEQATADPMVDHRADIYALGAMAYELLSGRTPFTAATPQAVLAAHVTEEPDPVRKYRKGISVELDAVVMRCLAKRPADRWQSTSEMLPYLEAAMTPSGGLTPTHTQPVPAAGAGSRGSRRRLLAVLGVAVAAAVGIGGWLALGGDRAAGPATIEQIAVLPMMDLSGKDTLFVSTLHDALISAIAREGVVGVVSRNGVLRVSSGDETTEEIATLLKVQAVMEGTIFRSGTVMRINVQLVEPTTLRYLWTGSYERDVSDVLGAQGALVQAIATEFGTALTEQAEPSGS